MFFARPSAAPRRAIRPATTREVHRARQRGAFRAALTVRDITDARARTGRRAIDDRALAAISTTRRRQASRTPASIGSRRRRTFAYQLDPILRALRRTDARLSRGSASSRTGTSARSRASATATASGNDGGGPQLPFYARNFQHVTQWIARLAPGDLMPRILALREGQLRGAAARRGHGREAERDARRDRSRTASISASALSPHGTGLVWAGVRPGEPIPMSERAVPADRGDRSTIVQVTNLGITVKDSPQSTLVFVTRLDNGEPVPARDRHDRQHGEQANSGAARPDRDGVALAPALPLRKPDDWYEFSFLVTAEKDGDVAYVGSDWNEGIMPWDFGTVVSALGVHRHPARIGVHRPRRLQAGRRGARQGDRARRHAERASGCCRPDRRSTSASATAANREVDRRTRHAEPVEQRRVDVDGAGRRHARQLPRSSARCPAPSGRTGQRRDADGATPQGEWLKQVTGSFLVAAYRRPDFRVDTTLVAERADRRRDRCRHASTRGISSAARWRPRPVKWSLTREPDYGVPAAIRETFPEERYVFGYYPRPADSTRRAIAGDDGRRSTRPASSPCTLPSTGRPVDFAYRYTFEGDVEDVSRQHIANRASLIVHPAPWYIGLRRPAYFADTATGTSVDVVAVDLARRIGRRRRRRRCRSCACSGTPSAAPKAAASTRGRPSESRSRPANGRSRRRRRR